VEEALGVPGIELASYLFTAMSCGTYASNHRHRWSNAKFTISASSVLPSVSGSIGRDSHIAWSQRFLTSSIIAILMLIDNQVAGQLPGSAFRSTFDSEAQVNVFDEVLADDV